MDGIRNDNLARDGFCIISGIWSPDQVAAAAAAVRAALADGVHASGVQVLRPRDLDPGLLRLLTGGGCARAIADLVGPGEFLSVKPVVKDGGHAFATPWHQDRPYWGGCAKWSLWIALDRVEPANGCLRVIRGSHRSALAHRRPDSESLGFVNRVEVDEARAEDVVLEAGDAVLFHDLLLHASHPCAAGRTRLALIPTYRALGADDASTVWDDPRPLEMAASSVRLGSAVAG